MSKHRILLICSQHLFGEGMENILRSEADMELIGTCDLGEDIHNHIAAARPDVVVLADLGQWSDEMIRLTMAIIEKNPEFSVICAGLTENVLRVFSAHLFPACSADLLEVIRNLPVAHKT